jgi:probable phosphoglycerate mutase
MTTQRSLVVVRHGRTQWNATGRFQGQADPPLDHVGHRQAQEAAEAIAPLRPGLIVTSDLRRAHQTAQALSSRCRLRPVLDARLREVDVGGWTGLDHTQAAHRYPDEYTRWKLGVDIRRGGGETLAEAGARAAQSLLTILATTAPGSTVVAVAHGLVLQAAMTRLAEQGVAHLPGRMPHLANGAWMWVPVTPNDTRRPEAPCAAGWPG